MRRAPWPALRRLWAGGAQVVRGRARLEELGAAAAAVAVEHPLALAADSPLLAVAASGDPFAALAAVLVARETRRDGPRAPERAGRAAGDRPPLPVARRRLSREVAARVPGPRGRAGPGVETRTVSAPGGGLDIARDGTPGGAEQPDGAARGGGPGNIRGATRATLEGASGAARVEPRIAAPGAHGRPVAAGRLGSAPVPPPTRAPGSERSAGASRPRPRGPAADGGGRTGSRRGEGRRPAGRSERGPGAAGFGTPSPETERGPELDGKTAPLSTGREDAGPSGRRKPEPARGGRLSPGAAAALDRRVLVDEPVEGIEALLEEREGAAARRPTAGGTTRDGRLGRRELRPEAARRPAAETVTLIERAIQRAECTTRAWDAVRWRAPDRRDMPPAPIPPGPAGESEPRRRVLGGLRGLAARRGRSPATGPGPSVVPLEPETALPAEILRDGFDAAIAESLARTLEREARRQGVDLNGSVA